MKRILSVVGGLVLVVCAWTVAHSVNVPLFVGPACQEASQNLSCYNQIITQFNSQLAQVPAPSTPRNLLDNGAINIQQRGTGIRTCAQAAAPGSAAYAADRWFCDANASATALRMRVITTAPTPPPGFAQSQEIYRQSGAVTQTGCAWEIIPTQKAVAMQGQQVTFSVYEQALAGLSSDQTTGESFSMIVISGTVADETASVGWTASPAITLAFTGLSTLVNTTFNTPATPAWGRYSVQAAVPTNALELAVGVCFTPTAAGASTTDGIAFVGAQLEAGSIATAFEFKDPQQELATAQRYFLRYNETDTVGAIVFGGGTALGTTTTCSINILFPVTMRVAPTYTNALTATTFTITSASQAATALSTPFSATLGANSVNNGSINFTTTGMTAKDTCEITSTAAGAGVLDFVADL